MKDKVKKALKDLLDAVSEHEAESESSEVEVDKTDLLRVLRYVQGQKGIYFVGDRVRRTGVYIGSCPALNTKMEGTVILDSGETGQTRVEWDDLPEGDGRVTMYHNEIKPVKVK